MGYSDRVMVVAIYVLLILLSFSALYPFWNTIVVSFNVGLDTAKGGITFWPRQFTWSNYEVFFSNRGILNAFMITILRTIIGSISAIFVTALVAYSMSRSQLMGRKYYTFYFIFTMYFGGGLIPTFLLINSLGLMNNFLVYIIPGLISVWNMIIFRTFFKSLPVGIEESAQIDGCSNMGVFLRIVLPLSGPVIATLGLFTAIAHWNDWFAPTIYITNEKLLPIQTILRRILNSNLINEAFGSGNIDSAMGERLAQKSITNKSIISAAIMVVSLPIIAVYPFVQKYFVKGVMIGSLKE
ncbi:MAG: carbohydrate ABC transporter permease [Candidatus Pristimantibacillus lignocellulolyticus]|uniref:Carbohydrate ABC transporter permease n=1 Tax=Candidatus Pristimantibacillus lignocellulolyticus TaxID=2994561 RepID=A0A9J6ZKW4_9BACL|nr:MAG: carbohydrate ABC transporter permease [Candidatus Pristimantibacillus lignocellulolyticus]